MSDIKAKAVWTVIKPGYEVSEKGCLKVGRSMIMPKDLQLIMDLSYEELCDMVKLAQQQNQAVNAVKEKQKVFNTLSATLGKVNGDKAALETALEEMLARIKAQ